MALTAPGAVFLPAAGRREGTSVSYVNSSGHYWSSTSDGINYAYQVFFDNSGLNPSSNPGRYYGCSVRDRVTLLSPPLSPPTQEGNFYFI